MTMGFTLKSSDVPVGVYDAKFVGIERTTHSAFGQFSTFISFLQSDTASR